MAKLKLWQRTSFWAKIVISFNLLTTSIQGALEAGHSEAFWKWFFLGIQLAGNIIAIFNEDKNKNDIPDLLEDEPDVQVTSTTTTTFKKNETPTSDTETTIEIKPKSE
jgi:hypothetical protein